MQSKLPYAVSLALLPMFACGTDSAEASQDSGVMTAATFGDTTGFEAGESGGSGMTMTESGDGDSTGDGDGTSGDGTTGDGTTGDGTTGDGTTGDGTTGDGDGTTGDGTTGDGTTGDGDGTTGDGDGTTGDGTTGDGDGTTGDGTTGDGTTTTGDGDGDGCFNEQFSFNGVPPSIMLVLDQSGSMTSTYDHDNNAATPNVSRWNALHIALTQILNNYDAAADFGVQLFPNDSSCGVSATPEVPIAAMNAANILATIPAATFSPNGLTPSGSGLQAAINYLTPYVAVGEKAIIFMADGGTSTSCAGPNTQTEIQTMLSTAYNGGVDPSIATYVVGINASGATATELDLFAVAGGVPQVQMQGVQFWNDSFETNDFSAGTYSQPSGTWTTDNLDAADGVYSAMSNGLTGGSITLTDDFETGNFSANAWTFGGNANWVVDGTDVSSGSFSAHSGNIADSQTSDLAIAVNLASAGTLTFDHRESTEGSFDHLQILIDGALQTEYDGLNAWAPASYQIPAGNHTITFRYLKDGSVSTNADTVYIDNVSIGVAASSDLNLDVNFAAAGNVWFHHRETAGPAGGTAFLIDGIQQANYSGTNAWAENYYAVSAGAHTLTWQHYGQGGGADEARVDNIRLEEGGSYGGTQYYDAQDTAELFGALDQIIGQLVSCDLVLNPPPPDPNQVEVALLGTTLPQLDPAAPGFDCATQSGWYYSSLNVVTLCGQACIDFENMAVPTADVTYFCMAS